MGGSIFMALVVLQNMHASALVMNSPLPAVTKMIKTLGDEQITLLLKHEAAQQTRSLYNSWEQVQILLAIVLGGCLYFATQKRILSVVLCGIMLALVLFQYFAITPELAYRGREMDFPAVATANNAAAAGEASSGLVRLLLLYQILVVTEALKLLIGGILASYLFVLRTSRRRSRREGEPEDAERPSQVMR